MLFIQRRAAKEDDYVLFSLSGGVNRANQVEGVEVKVMIIKQPAVSDICGDIVFE